jgi:hypothetical protein
LSLLLANRVARKVARLKSLINKGCAMVMQKDLIEKFPWPGWCEVCLPLPQVQCSDCEWDDDLGRPEEFIHQKVWKKDAKKRTG